MTWAGRGAAAVLLAVWRASAGMGAPPEGARPASSLPGVLDVASQPPGAAVILDGAWVGTTPLTIEGVTPGSHQVRLVKASHLEQRSQVSVTAGRVLRLSARLTRHADAAPTPSGDKGGGGSKAKAVALAALGAAADVGGAYLISRESNGPPLPAFRIDMGGSAALASATAVQFDGSASSDPGGDALRFEWRFGDGASAGPGSTVQHVYQEAGDYTVALSVSEATETRTAHGTVPVRSVTGNWTLRTFQSFECRSDEFRLSLSQKGGSLSGVIECSSCMPPVVEIVIGTVQAPRRIELSIRSWRGMGFAGTGDGGLRSFRGTAFDFCPAILER